MGLINYKDIDFNKSINKELKTFEFNGSEISIIPYLSIQDKYNLVMFTLQKSFENGVYNHIKLDMYFDLHLVYMYTNIDFSNEDKNNENDLYDILKRSGLIDKVIEQIDEKEIETLYSYIFEMEEIIIKYRNTFGAVIGAFIEQLPENMERATEIMDNFDPEKYSMLTNMAANLKANFPGLLDSKEE